MGEMLKWQEECAQIMRDCSILEIEYIYKMKKLREEYQPKIDDYKKQIQNIYIANGLIQAEGDNDDGKVVQEL